MLRNQKLLSAGLTILLAISGQSIVQAGGNGGHGGGGGGSFHAASHSVGNAMSHQSSTFKPVNHTVQTGKMNYGQIGKMTNQQSHNVLAHNTQLSNHVKSHLPVSPISSSSSQLMKGSKFPGNSNMGKVNSIFANKPICPQFGGGYGKGGYGGCWGNGYGNCWGKGCGWGGWGYGNCGYGGYGCSNYGYGNYGYGCTNYGYGYYPGYFSGCYSYPIVQTCPVRVFAPVCVSSVTTAIPAVASVVLNNVAVPPSPVQ